jgi:hypothetical protein
MPERNTGLDMMRIWSMETYEQIASPERGLVLRGQPSCLVWSKRQGDQRNILAFGTGLGHLVFWRHDLHKASASLLAVGVSITEWTGSI